MAGATDTTASEGSDNGPSKLDVTRWVLALVLAVLAALFWFHAIDHQSICEAKLTGEGAATADVCGPPRLLDLAPFALVIAVLLWPDLGELAVTGLFTLRRRVTAQEERQQAMEGHLLQISQQLTQVTALSQSQLAIGAVNHYYAADQKELSRNIEAKEAGSTPRHASGETPPVAGFPDRASGIPSPSVPEPAPSAPDEEEETYRLLGEFLDQYALLEPYLAPFRLRGAAPELDPDRQALVDEWNAMFRSEIAALRQTRNAIVHRPGSVGVDTLRGAIDNTRELARILFGRLE